MRCVRPHIILAIAMGFLARGKSHAQEKDADLGPLLAVEKAIQKVLGKVENSVVAITVSRSDGYQRIGKGPDREFPGRLGIFDPIWLKPHAGFTDQKENEAFLRKLDLSHPSHIPQGIGSGVVIDTLGPD